MKGNVGKVLLALVFLALAGNLLALTDVLHSTPDAKANFTAGILFAALLAGCGFASTAGIVLVSKAHEKHEKSSLVWMRRAFALALLETALVAAAPWLFLSHDEPVAERMHKMCLVLFPFGILVGLFAMAAWREHARAAGHGGRSHSSGRGAGGGSGPPSEA